MRPAGEAVLLTGVYGTGKTSVCAEIAERLEAAGAAYGALDLDWLAWVDAPGLDAAAARRLHLRNVETVAERYADAGADRLVLAGAVRSREDLAGLRGALPFPLRVVRLTLSLPEIGRRLSSDPSTGRQRDLRNAAAWLERGDGADLGDLVVANDRPLPVVTDEILHWLGWP